MIRFITTFQIDFSARDSVRLISKRRYRHRPSERPDENLA